MRKVILEKNLNKETLFLTGELGLEWVITNKHYVFFIKHSIMECN